MRSSQELASYNEVVRKYIDDLEREDACHPRESDNAPLEKAQAVETASDAKPLPGNFFLKKAYEFYWTTTRALGMAYLHDGSRERAALRSARLDEARSFFVGLPPGTLERSRDSGRILIDVTETTRCGIIAGASRSVAKIAERGCLHDETPVVMHDGDLWTFDGPSMAARKIQVDEGDIFLMADVSWHAISDVVSIMERVAEVGARNVFVLYDILPLTHPALFPDAFDKVFGPWLEEVLARVDAVIAISEYVAWDLVRYVDERSIPVKDDMRIGWAHLGSDIGLRSGGAASAAVVALCAKDDPVVLMVGTVERRKGHSIALSAMEILWDAGSEAQLVIVGRRGWHFRSVIERIRNHPEFGRRLIWIDNASDDDLRHLYENAHLSIYPSVAEGFGLPVVEAAAFGLEVVASDIPVIREIASDDAIFFKVGDHDALADRLKEALARPKRRVRANVKTWAEAADLLFERIRASDYQLGRLRDAAALLS